MSLTAIWDSMTGGTLIVGVDEEKRRVYVKHRAEGIYYDEPKEAVDEGISLWNRSSGHVSIPAHIVKQLNFHKEPTDD